jgi:hypothetical protein
LGERIEIRVPDKEVNSLLSVALGAGAEVVSVTRNRHSLEQAFLSAVQGEKTSPAGQQRVVEKTT